MTPQRLKTLQEDGDAIVVLDQTRLPSEAVFQRLDSLESVANAIINMQVRGAPLIGATAAYGVAIGLADDATDARLAYVIETLAATRPTAVNLQWALRRMDAEIRQLEVTRSVGLIQPTRCAGANQCFAKPLLCRCCEAWKVASRIAAEDEAANAAIGNHGLKLLLDLQTLARPIQIMTHCNAGRLATVAHGTALAPVYAAHEAGIAVHVWVSETRPRNQGLLTAWELAEAGIPHTLFADNAAGLLMMQGRVDVVLVGADRIAANGDTANKIGTYLKALAAKAHGVRFYVAAPLSTFDFRCENGAEIPIEERAANELHAGGISVANPAFDITPAHLISGFISERGVLAAGDLLQWKT
ncbi:MAG: S-methyl-5-thioribose-1-phosphate isomerase [Rhodocyclaceae bacterium]|nr:S-methyl-5-thioribose-1-phosphate isomerase [Rhodocyclaceae bacterium]